MPWRERILQWSGAVFGLALAGLPLATACAAPASVAIADFGYSDSSGEIRDQTAEHAARVAALKRDVVTALQQNAHWRVTSVACDAAPCDPIARARANRADILVQGGVHKMSTLVQWGQLRVVDTSTGQVRLNRTFSFRGDSDAAWAHAARFMASEIAGTN